MGSGAVVSPPSLSTVLYSRVSTLKWRVWSYGVWYCCAPTSLPLDTSVLSPSDGGGEDRVLRGLVLLCPLPPS